MSDETTGEAAPKKKRWSMRILFFFIAFFISIAIGKAFELASDPETLASARQAQTEWLQTVQGTSPIAVATTYWVELNGAWWGESSAATGAWCPSCRSWRFPDASRPTTCRRASSPTFFATSPPENPAR